MAKQQNDFISGLSDEQKEQIKVNVKGAVIATGGKIAKQQKIDTKSPRLYLELGLRELGARGSEDISLDKIPKRVKVILDSVLKKIIQGSSNNETLISDDTFSSIISNTILTIAAEVEPVPIPPTPPQAARKPSPAESSVPTTSTPTTTTPAGTHPPVLPGKKNQL
jgi:hypothetical protein